AEQIQLVEGGDPLVVKAAAVLYYVDEYKAQTKNNSKEKAENKEDEGCPIAREILIKYGVDTELIEQICQLISSRLSEKEIDTIEYRILSDALRLVHFREKCTEMDKREIQNIIDASIQTQRAKQIATGMFINSLER
ncbi:MAG: HD domain-containing protein, partial [Planctomycetota bacterium]